MSFPFLKILQDNMSAVTIAKEIEIDDDLWCSSKTDRKFIVEIKKKFH